MSVSDASRYTNETYVLNDNVKQLLTTHGHDAHQFTTCHGNQLDHVIHQESVNLLERVDSLSSTSLLYDHQNALVDFTVAMVAYNHERMTDKATQIADLCWTLLDLGQAVAEGAALGIYSAAHDILTNPIETTVCIIAGKEILAYHLCKFLYNVTDIGVTAITDWDHAKDKWTAYTAPLNNIINAISKKELTLRETIKGGTAFVVGLKAQSKLLGGLGKFCTTIQHKSINFIQKNPLLKPHEYLTTPEGLLLKATNKIQPSGRTASATKIKNNVESKLATNSVIQKEKNVAKTDLIEIVNTSKGIIRNISRNLRSTIQKYEEHIFSPDHKRDGIMALGKNQEIIMNSLNDVIMSIDKKGLLREGSNQIRVMINGIDNVEIRCCIKNGEVISINAFISDFGRIYNDFLDIAKV